MTLTEKGLRRGKLSPESKAKVEIIRQMSEMFEKVGAKPINDNVFFILYDMSLPALHQQAHLIATQLRMHGFIKDLVKDFQDSGGPEEQVK